MEIPTWHFRLPHLLQLKLRQDIEDWFVHVYQQQFLDMNMDYIEQVSKISGRVEIRRCWAIADGIAMEHIVIMKVELIYKRLFGLKEKLVFTIKWFMT